MKSYQNVGYRTAMIDSGRGHLLPDAPRGVRNRFPQLPWHRSFCNECRVGVGLDPLDRNEHMKLLKKVRQANHD